MWNVSNKPSVNSSYAWNFISIATEALKLLRVMFIFLFFFPWHLSPCWNLRLHIFQNGNISKEKQLYTTAKLFLWGLWNSTKRTGGINKCTTLVICLLRSHSRAAGSPLRKNIRLLTPKHSFLKEVNVANHFKSFLLYVKLEKYDRGGKTR